MNLYGTTLTMTMKNSMPIIIADRITKSLGGIVISGGVDIIITCF